MKRREKNRFGRGIERGLLMAWVLSLTCLVSAAQSPTTSIASPPKPASTASNAPSAPGGAKAPVVAVSSTPVHIEPGVPDLYPLEKYHLRDPFMQAGGGGSGGYEQGQTAAFSIHGLVLKGILHDLGGDFALFVDASTGSNYVLRKNVLYDNKNRPMPGVSGIIKPQLKTVHLLTSDQDVQTFVLGEERGLE